MSHTATEWPRRHRLTVGDYYRMGEAGILRPDERVELIEGEIIDMPPIGTRHSAAVDRLVELLGRALRDKAIVRSQNPVFLDDYSEPEPDIALLRRRSDFYATAHPRPGDVLLIIEVAESSLAYDRDVKAPLYARHGVPEVWLVDIQKRRVARYRTPANGTYVNVDEPRLDMALDIGSLADASVELGRLFSD